MEVEREGWVDECDKMPPSRDGKGNVGKVEIDDVVD